MAGDRRHARSQAEEAVPALVNALRDPHKYVRGEAVQALRRIDPEEAGKALMKFLVAFRWT